MRNLALARAWRLVVLTVGIGVASAPAGAADTALVTVPFVSASHELIVRASVGRHGPYLFLLDTGTSPSIIDARLAKTLRLRPAGNAGYGSGIGSRKTIAVPVTIPDVRLGALHVARLAALALDLSEVRAGMHLPIMGVLGTSLLHGRVFRIDYSCRTVAFLPDAPLEPFTASFHEDADGNNLSDDVWVGSRRVTATFDTGDSGYSFVSARGIVRLGKQGAARRGRASLTLGFNGTAKETHGTIEDLRIGPVRMGTVPTRFLATTIEPYDINIGNRIFEQFVVTLDYQRGLLTLSQPKPCR